MKLKKLLIASAVVAAVAGAMSTAAFAEEHDLGLQWNAETKTVTVTNNPTFEGDKTMIVIPCDEDGGLKTEINQEDIKQIDQKAGGYTDIKFTDLAPGKYEVRIGGDGNLYSEIFEVKGEVDPDNPYADSTRLLGNVNDDENIDEFDATTILDYVVGYAELEGEKLEAADADDNGEPNEFDATTILDYVVGYNDSLGDKQVKDKKYYVYQQ